MLSLLKIKNIALIDEIQLEFSHGLNLLTGETGSGKSIIVDSLGALTGERVSSDLIKEGESNAQIEGLFNLTPSANLHEIFYESGIDSGDSEEIDLIVRRELAASGRNRIFVNNQLVTSNFLKKIGAFLVDIHGQGEQATLFNPLNHLEILDEYASLKNLRTNLSEKYRDFAKTQREIENLREDEAQKLQLLDVLQFQVDEINKVNLQPGEDDALNEEKRRLNNVEKLSALSDEAYLLLYDNEEATVSTLEKAARKIEELSEYESSFKEYDEGLQTAQAVLEDLAISVRDFRNRLEFSPERLEEIENRLAEISRLKRKYGGAIETVLAHLQESEERLKNIETFEERKEELKKILAQQRENYLISAREIHDKRTKAARRFEKEVETNLKAVALEKARFEVRIDAPNVADLQSGNNRRLTAKGFNQIEFYFSANVGESPKPLARVASGGEASRLMLILKTTAKAGDAEKSVVFDEIDVGIGGRVAEAVGLKLKELARTQQVLCVTHQAQIASLADQHFLVEKETVGKKTRVSARDLNEKEKVEEIARMLTGAQITETARKHAKEMLGAAK
ncbi:MAG: DNA repair protein RecN [Acidobacteria bacterium]|jgi:DNA repair protein RecN (Recombination protein N)|nr:DNA repair protein RecN [Acidobacteriota bacterium]